MQPHRLAWRLPRWLAATLRWLAVAVVRILQAAVVLWAALALYFSNLPWRGARVALLIAMALLGVYALWFASDRRWRWALAAAVVAVMIWFSLIPPSHDRTWRGDVAVMPRALVNGDIVRFTGFRDFTYRTRDDFDAHYLEREVDISHLQSVDLLISYWSPGPVGHTFVSFNFDNAPPVCISIETRPEQGEGFAPIASMFKQFELIYVVGSERDLIRSRTNQRDEDVFMYPVRVAPETARNLFRVYLDRINELDDHAEWYHLLSNSCTINIVRYANAIGRTGGWRLQHIANGWFDRYLYGAGLVDTSLPFAELRARSRITDDALNAPDDDTFSTRIRAALPGPAPAAPAP